VAKIEIASLRLKRNSSFSYKTKLENLAILVRNNNYYASEITIKINMISIIALSKLALLMWCDASDANKTHKDTDNFLVTVGMNPSSK
jgi:hypothetical protein